MLATAGRDEAGNRLLLEVEEDAVVVADGAVVADGDVAAAGDGGGGGWGGEKWDPLLHSPWMVPCRRPV